jgi:hypothetical protein
MNKNNNFKENLQIKNWLKSKQYRPQSDDMYDLGLQWWQG